MEIAANLKLSCANSLDPITYVFMIKLLYAYRSMMLNMGTSIFSSNILTKFLVLSSGIPYPVYNQTIVFFMKLCLPKKIIDGIFFYNQNKLYIFTYKNICYLSNISQSSFPIEIVSRSSLIAISKLQLRAMYRNI